VAALALKYEIAEQTTAKKSKKGFMQILELLFVTSSISAVKLRFGGGSRAQ
jgi:hypothetical protein